MASGMVLNAAAQTPAAPAATAAPAAAPAGPAKIAVIAWEAAVAQTNEGQRDFADLQKKYAPKEATLKTLNDEIETLTKQLQDQGQRSATWSAPTAARPSTTRRSNWTARQRICVTTANRICRICSAAFRRRFTT